MFWSPITAPIRCLSDGQKLFWSNAWPSSRRTILDEYVQTLLDRECGVEDDESEAQWEDIVACANFEEITNRPLWFMSDTVSAPLARVGCLKNSSVVAQPVDAGVGQWERKCRILPTHASRLGLLAAQLLV